MSDKHKIIHELVSRVVQVDKVDANGRFWSKKVVQEAIDEFNKRVPVLSTLEDPCTSFGSASIDLSSVSHSIIGVGIRAGCITASYQVLDTPHGDLLQALLDDGSIAISAKIAATGILDQNKNITEAKFINIGVNADSLETPTTSLNDVQF